MNQYLEYIDEQIKFHGTELEKHMNAREIMLRVMKKVTPPKAKQTSAPRKDSVTMQRIIEERLHVGGGKTGAELVRLIFPEAPTKKERHAVYNALSRLKGMGKIVKTGNSWALVQKAAA